LEKRKQTASKNKRAWGGPSPQISGSHLRGDPVERLRNKKHNAGSKGIAKKKQKKAKRK